MGNTAERNPEDVWVTVIYCTGMGLRPGGECTLAHVLEQLRLAEAAYLREGADVPPDRRSMYYARVREARVAKSGPCWHAPYWLDHLGRRVPEPKHWAEKIAAL